MISDSCGCVYRPRPTSLQSFITIGKSRKSHGIVPTHDLLLRQPLLGEQLVTRHFYEVSLEPKSLQSDFLFPDAFRLLWSTQGTFLSVLGQFFPTRIAFWSKFWPKRESSMHKSMPSRDRSILKWYSDMKNAFLPWVLCMALKFELFASKLFSMCVVCLKLSTCWKELNMIIFFVKSFLL